MCGLDVFVGCAIAGVFLRFHKNYIVPAGFRCNSAGTFLRACSFAEEEMDDLDIIFKVTGQNLYFLILAVAQELPSWILM